MADECESLLLVSALMAGAPCRYHGGASTDPAVVDLVTRGEAIPACPEMLAGLGTPRRAAEIIGGDGADVLEGRARVVDDTGRDVTEAFIRGAWIVFRRAQQLGLRQAILKDRSPSCGGHQVYDGSFSGSVRIGEGATAALLRRHGMNVLTTLPDEG